MLKVALSGGIGAGKSAAGAIFAGFGAEVLSADEIGHEIIAPGGPAFDAVARRWPEVVVDGSIERRALGRVVFGDPTALQELEALTHPAIKEELERRIDRSGFQVVMVEIPLLDHFLGEGWVRVVVDAPDEVRRARLRSRGLTDGEITLRMASQPGRARWLRSARWVIDNSGDLEMLSAEVRRVWKLITTM